MLDNYIFLLRQRHGDAIITDVTVTSLDRHIVPLTLQLLVENAVKHNVVSKSRPLSIALRETADGFIEIENTIKKKLDKERGTGFGLSSLTSRYNLLTPKKIVVSETESTFLVRIPII